MCQPRILTLSSQDVRNVGGVNNTPTLVGDRGPSVAFMSAWTPISHLGLPPRVGLSPFGSCFCFCIFPQLPRGRALFPSLVPPGVCARLSTADDSLSDEHICGRVTVPRGAANASGPGAHLSL